MTSSLAADVPAQFAQALASLRAAARDVGLDVREIPAPTRAAAFAVALAGSLRRPGDDEEIADGQFVLLFDPSDVAGADGTFRVLVLVRAELDPEMSSDPMLADVAWTWVEEATAPCGRIVEALGGSVTRTVTTSHGAVAQRPDRVELEIRASWTTTSSDAGAQLRAWAHVVRSSAGVPQLPDGVTSLGTRR